MGQSETVFVGMDGSAASEHALGWAVAFARARHRKVRPVNVWHHPTEFFNSFPVSSELVTDAQLQIDAQHSVNRWFDDWQVENDPDGVVLQPDAVHGEPATALVERSAGSALLVVGSRGLGALKGLILGSVSSKCAAHATCPIAVIPERPQQTQVRRVIVGHDGSEQADAALSWAIFSFPASTIDVINAWTVPVPVEPYGTAMGREVYAEWASKTVEAAIAKAESAADYSECTLRAVTEYGDARRVLNQRAVGDGADVLVVGAQAEHGIGRLVMGSVAQSVLHHLEVATVVVPSLVEV